MSTSTLEIRSASSDEMPQAIASITAAFITDPVARFVCPEVHRHLEMMPRVTHRFAGKSFEHGTADVSEGFGGVGLWLPPEVHTDEEAIEAEFRAGAHPAHLDDLLRTFDQMGECHPEEPHWYLPLIGVEPNSQGQGLGGALLRHALARCDRDGAVAYLESSNPKNISLYQRHGFEILGEIQVGAAPVVTPMRRPAR